MSATQQHALAGPGGVQTFDERLRTLSEASTTHYFNAFVDVDWDGAELAVDPQDERWILHDVDLLGAHPWYQGLSRERQIEVGRQRVAAMTKSGLQFEQLLLLGGTQFLMGLRNDNPEFRYFMHELTEETHHIQMFQEFTNRVCPEVSGVPPWLLRLFPLLGHLGGLAPAVFFALILAGEEPIDHVQKEIMRRGGSHPLVDRVMSIHIAEEARHIGFAHAWLAEHAPRLNRRARLAVGLITPVVMRAGSDIILMPSRADRELMGLPGYVVAEVYGKGSRAAKFRRDQFGDIRMLFDDLGLRGRSTRWLWRALGIEGRPSRFRGEPSPATS